MKKLILAIVCFAFNSLPTFAEEITVNGQVFETEGSTPISIQFNVGDKSYTLTAVESDIDTTPKSKHYGKIFVKPTDSEEPELGVFMNYSDSKSAIVNFFCAKLTGLAYLGFAVGKAEPNEVRRSLVLENGVAKSLDKVQAKDLPYYKASSKSVNTMSIACMI